MAIYKQGFFACRCGKIHQYGGISYGSVCACGRKLYRATSGEKTMHPWKMDRFLGIFMPVGMVGGDTQVGEAYSARFINPDFPRSLIEMTVFVSAPELLIADQPECTHEEPPGGECKNGWDDLHKPDADTRCMCWIPPEHLSCTHDMDSLGLTAYTEYVIAREGLMWGASPWDDAEWEHLSPDESLDTRPFNRDVEAANKAAEQWISSFDPERDISWNGEPF